MAGEFARAGSRASSRAFTICSGGREHDMFGDGERAQRYREHAAELRKIAVTIADGNTQRILLSLAVEYELLASLQESRDGLDRGLAAFKEPG